MGISLQQYRINIGKFTQIARLRSQGGYPHLCGCYSNCNGTNDYTFSEGRSGVRDKCSYNFRYGTLYSTCKYYASLWCVLWCVLLLLYKMYQANTLAQSNDIESNPGPFTVEGNGFPQNHVAGDFHQGDSRFSPQSRGNQCYPNSLVALIYTKIKETQEWVTSDINEILILGDKLYQLIRLQTNYNHLNMSDLPCFVEIFEYICNVQQDDQILAQRVPSVPGILSLNESLSQCFETNDCTLICIGSYALAVIKTGTHYYVFDSHARDNKGLPHPDGTAVLLLFANIEYLCEYFEKLCIALGQHENAIIELTGVNILYTKNSCQSKGNRKRKLSHSNDYPAAKAVRFDSTVLLSSWHPPSISQFQSEVNDDLKFLCCFAANIYSRTKHIKNWEGKDFESLIYFGIYLYG